MQITIDTYRFVKFLEEKKHFTHEQAETLVEAAVQYSNQVSKDLATKHDTLLIKQEIALLKQDIKSKRRIWLYGLAVLPLLASLQVQQSY